MLSFLRVLMQTEIKKPKRPPQVLRCKGAAHHFVWKCIFNISCSLRSDKNWTGWWLGQAFERFCHGSVTEQAQKCVLIPLLFLHLLLWVGGRRGACWGQFCLGRVHSLLVAMSMPSSWLLGAICDAVGYFC